MLKKQLYKRPLMELKASHRFISDAFLRVSLWNQSSSKVAHFFLVETAFTKYCISSNKRFRQVLNLKAARCGADYRVALIKERRSFQS